MTPEECRTLFEYDAWANERSRSACAALSAEQFTRNLGSSFPSVRDTLVHIFGAQQIWLDRYLGRPASGLPAPEGFADLAAIQTRGAEVQRELNAFVAGLSAADRTRVLDYKTIKGKPSSDPLEFTLQHLANHNTYHRGQIATLLRQLGVKPVSTDMIAFYRQRAAAMAS